MTTYIDMSARSQKRVRAGETPDSPPKKSVALGSTLADAEVKQGGIKPKPKTQPQIVDLTQGNIIWGRDKTGKKWVIDLTEAMKCHEEEEKNNVPLKKRRLFTYDSADDIDYDYTDLETPCQGNYTNTIITSDDENWSEDELGEENPEYWNTSDEEDFDENTLIFNK